MYQSKTAAQRLARKLMSAGNSAHRELYSLECAVYQRAGRMLLAGSSINNGILSAGDEADFRAELDRIEQERREVSKLVNAVWQAVDAVDAVEILK